MKVFAAACLVLLATEAAGQAPARDTPPPRTGTSRILGRVVDAENGQPLARALVRVMSPAIRDPRTIMTDREGRYEFGGLPGATYSLSAQKAGFVQVFYGQKRFENLGPGKPIDLGEKESLAGIDVRLPRGGVITGTVVDEYGEPVAGVQVTPMQFRYSNGGKQLVASGMGASTADNGEFRAWGLRPGDYAVAAVMRPVTFGSDISDDRVGFARTFYPGTANPEQAQSVRIEAGKIVASLVITLVPVRTARVTGIAIGTDGAQLRSGFVNAMPRLGNRILSSGGGAGAAIRPDGTFTIGALPPGEWILQTPSAPESNSGDRGSSVAMIAVNESDVDGVVLTPLQPARMSGRIFFSNAAAAAAVRPAAVRVTTIAVDQLPVSAGRISEPTVKEDFSFSAEVQPGTGLIRGSVAGPPGRAWSLKAVRHHGVDITDRGVTFGPGQRLEDMEIELTNVAQTVGGFVADAKGEPAADAAVFVFSQDRERWFPPTRFATVATADRQGRYVVRTLPSGEYHAIALDYLDNNRRVGDTEYLDELTRQATQFKLNEGETKALDLKLVLSP
jgi:protocatechuate 3,4-dioxygenase beta subunit